MKNLECFCKLVLRLFVAPDYSTLAFERDMNKELKDQIFLSIIVTSIVSIHANEHEICALDWVNE